MSSFLFGVVVGGLFFGYLGLRYGGRVAFKRLGDSERRDRHRRARL